MVAVSVYTVVVVGATDCDPVVEETVPGAGEMETDVAPEIFHCKVEDCPAVMLLGLAVKLVTPGSPVEPMVTVAVAVTVP